MAVYDDQKQDEQKDTTTLPGDDELRARTGISASEEKEMEDSARSDVAKKEDDFAGKQSGQESEGEEVEPVDLYNPGAAIGSATPFGKFQVMFGKNKKGFMAGGFIGIFMLVIVGGMGSLIPHELIHIKEVVAQNIGGVQQDVLDKRRMRILQKAYFFRDDGKFAGYKQKGTLFSFLDNRKSNKLVTDLETRGYKIDPELNGTKWTGKFKSIIGPDGVPLNDSDSLWSRRSAMRAAIDDTYPSKSALWRSKQTSLMYKRYGLTRGKWWTDNEATRKMTSAKERLKEKVRSAMMRGSPANPTVDPAQAGKDKDGKPIPAEQAKAGEINSGIQDALAAEQEAAKTGVPTPPLNGDVDINPTTGLSAVGGSVLKVAGITQVADNACQIAGIGNTIVVTSRAAKALQLAQYSSLILAAADGMKAGDVDGKMINDIMIAVNGLDPETKKNFFASGGWLSVSGKSPVKATYGTTYDAGGGLTGQLKGILDTAYSSLGGKKNVKGTCKTLANPFVQAGSAVVGIGAIVFSGGTIGVGKLALQAAYEVAKFTLIGYGTQLAIKAATGTIISGTEVGERMGDAFMSGSGRLFAMNGMARGFRPLTKTEYVYQQNEFNANQNAKFAAMPLSKRMFSLENQNSISSKALDTFGEAQNSNVASFIAKIPSLFGSFISAKTLAEDANTCNQEEIVNANIQTDSFCNPIIGNTDSELNKIDPIENLIWMYDNNYVDGNGTPQGDYQTYTDSCFDSATGNTLFDDTDPFVSEFVSTCFDAGPDGAKATSNNVGLYERFRAFRLDSGLLECLNQYIDQGHCDETNTAADTTTDTSTGGGTPTEFADASTKQVLDSCNNGTATGQVKIICAAVGMSGIPYVDSASNTAAYLTKDPSGVVCNQYTNISILRATNGKYKKGYCSQQFGTIGVNEGQFQKIEFANLSPGDIVIRESSCGCGCTDSQGRSGHVAMVASYNNDTNQVVVAEASSPSHPSGIRTPMQVQWSPNNKWGYTYALRYVGGGL